ncbi:hypothetical protein D3C76_749390 [compost metagenome]|uniref:Uncharacterized protein n=1 Tax=Pseudomonas jinjuensis TaxID=198616 RepID=A0A1H0JRH7_9PSED|nr:hypothetical protein [Pseudomonas jinjuensis]SDO46405.1 hypothetical protein SAMN05216193_111182 [Pseudomonas jinjuensis]
MRNQLAKSNNNLPGVLYAASGELDGCRASVMADGRSEVTMTFGPASVTLSAAAMIELITHLHKAMGAVVDHAEKEGQQ